MRKFRPLAALVLLPLLLVACGDDDEDDDAAPSAAEESPSEAMDESEEEATVGLAETSLGEILVDAEGRTLYLFTNDTAGTSNCNDACAQAWPPLEAEGELVAGDGLDGELSAVTRADGSEQVAYEGVPLYRFARDAAAGDTNGQGVGGVWYVVGADGKAITATAGASTTAGGGAAAGELSIEDNAFSPPSLRVARGTEVTVTNQDAAAHTWTADDGAFDSGSLAEGSSFSHTFDEAGTYDYHCAIHPSMVGTVTVTG